MKNKLVDSDFDYLTRIQKKYCLYNAGSKMVPKVNMLNKETNQHGPANWYWRKPNNKILTLNRYKLNINSNIKENLAFWEH